MTGVFTLHGALAASADRDPGTPAISGDGERWTYGELEARAGRIAAGLTDLGVSPGDLVGICAAKSPTTVAALYGVMGAGAAYVPLDPQSPPKRIGRIVDDAGCAALVADAERLARLRGAGAIDESVPVVGLGNGPFDEVAVTVDDLAAADPSPLVRGCETDLAYVLYTSGSTGAPKGVMLSHRNALAFVEWMVWRFGIGAGDRLSSHAPFHFDLSVFDLFGAARAGASVRLLSTREAAFGRDLAAVVADEGLTVWYSVPSALVALCDATEPDGEQLASLHTVFFAGEVFPTKHLRRLRALLPQATLANLYGPTETNVCTYWVVPDVLESDAPIPIGRACENQQVMALDDEHRPVGVGGTGELFVRGPTVMKGYLGDAERTAERLAQNPLHNRFGDPTYRTGDLVRLRSDGDLDFLGRRDHQIKSRGYRIELGEIEAALLAHPAVRAAAVVAVPDEVIGNALIGYVATTDDVDELDLKRHCADHVPRYMVPGSVFVDDALPRTSTGKIDRQALQTQAAEARR